MPVSNGMTIGALASQTQCTVPTIRYYEEIGLLPRASRRFGGHRVYGDADLRRLTFIRRCRDFGFPIEQIREFVTLVGSLSRDCTAARDLAQHHLDEVRRKVKELRALERSLKHYVEDCDAHCAGGPAAACVILEDLATPNPTPCCGSTAPVRSASRTQSGRGMKRPALRPARSTRSASGANGGRGQG
jgi:DNA-binding transcriptional MerR regulator